MVLMKRTRVCGVNTPQTLFICYFVRFMENVIFAKIILFFNNVAWIS